MSEHFTDFNENELTELFSSEPIFISVREAGMFMYGFIDSNGIEIIIDVSIYEKKVDLILCQNGKTIFEISLSNVENMLSENKCLRIHQANATQDIIIQFSPMISVKYIDA